jgi:hypothetical protein
MARPDLDALTYGPIDEMIAAVAQFSRNDAKQALLDFTAMRLDFTDEYLDSLATEQLRHVLLAAIFQVRRSVEAVRLAAAG